MNRIRLTGALLLWGLVAGCSHSVDLTRESTQIDVGVDAAKMNLWREALFRFQRAVQLDPNDAMAHNNLAVAYEGTGDFEKARVNYIEALRLDKGNEYIQKNFSRFTEFTSRNKKRGKATATPKLTKAGSAPPASTASQPEAVAPGSVAAPAGTAPSSAPPSGSPAIPGTASPAPAPASPPPPPKPNLPGGSL